MRHYLSFGGGVNSVALYLLMEELGMDFEAVFVDHGGDLPETYEYIEYFSSRYPLTVLQAEVHKKKIGKTWYSIIDYCRDTKRIPLQYPRWCTGDWKRIQVNRYIERPCFMHIGIDSGECHRAKMNTASGVESRWLLIEHGIDRQGCIDLIRRHGLSVPPKSGCYICPFQSDRQLKDLRRDHPDLFCILRRLEEEAGQTLKRGVSALSRTENNYSLFPDLVYDYPPCECSL
ncbi:MAG: hypothetical protein D3916_12795 [Candidatus Electrothrix sp. MAN1_4]|nr:hypothetical protein [Candidatus Electrothrix sp. MAN1_4]